jgi:DUF4097 and DUF4098 domain-containing protein YvlB
MSVYDYRRGSIFWALTIIAVGVIFLWQNFNPAIHPWTIIAKFWPILIIFWGLSKLIDYLQAQTHPESAAPRIFTGSEVILLLLILILGTMVSRFVLRPWHEWPSAVGINVDDEDFANLFLNSFTYTQTVSQNVPRQPRLQIVNRRGDVEIRAADQSTLDAVVKKTIRADNEDAAKKISSELKIELVERAGRYVLETNLDSLPHSGRTVRLDLSLRAPTGTNAEITTEHGDILLDGLHGDQDLTPKHGAVHVSNVNGLVRVHKSGGLTEIREVKGTVELDGRGRDVEVAGVTGTVNLNGEFSGALQFRNVTQTLRFNSSRTDMTVQKLDGRLNMELGSLDASGVNGPFEISTRQKDITIEDFRHAVKIVNTNGDVRLRTAVPPTHSIDVDLKKGEIDLTLPSASNFQIEARSTRGDVDCDFSGPNLKTGRQGGAPSITGFYGKGGPTIHLTTAYGTIRLARGGGRPGTPPSPSTGGEEKTTGLYRPHRLHDRRLKQDKAI